MSFVHATAAILLALLDILQIWAQRLHRFFVSKPDEERLTDDLANATDYTRWYKTAVALDNLPARYDWRVNPIDDRYAYRHLDERRTELRGLMQNDRPAAVAKHIRHGLMRNLFGITQIALFKENYTSTKESIQQYVEETVDAIDYIKDSPVALTSAGGRLTAQDKLDTLHGSRSVFGSTALVLQGGSIFGLCHLGVVKALNDHNLLPRVIVGTATGALMAALVGIHTLNELPEFLSSDRIDLSAFSRSSQRAKEKTQEQMALLETPQPHIRPHSWYSTLARRANRLVDKGFLLDPQVLSDCVEANVGDMTFEEAYKRTGRILNIIISSPSEEIPNLMNYLTAPKYLIRSAAMASHITNMASGHQAPIQLLQKNASGQVEIVEVGSARKHGRGRRPPSVLDRKTPLTRLKQQFNVDNFIISQARPYIAPFVEPSLPYIRKQSTWLDGLTGYAFGFAPSLRLLRQVMINLDIFEWLPDYMRRILSDETVKGHSLTLVPQVGLRDWGRLLKNPTKEEVDFWIMQGERSVWPSLCAIKVRCLIEISLEQAYERVRRRRPSDPDPPFAMGRMHAALTPPAGTGTMLKMTPGLGVQAEDPFDDSRRRKVPRLMMEESDGLGNKVVESTDDETPQ